MLKTVVELPSVRLWVKEYFRVAFMSHIKTCNVVHPQVICSSKPGFYLFYHLRMRRDKAFGRVCMYRVGQKNRTVFRCL